MSGWLRLVVVAVLCCAAPMLFSCRPLARGGYAVAKGTGSIVYGVGKLGVGVVAAPFKMAGLGKSHSSSGSGRGQRSYVVRGRRYTPLSPQRARRYRQTGLASWYGAGQRTANGEYFRPSAMTAAHKTLPFNTKVRVTNLENRRRVVLRINDRGPFKRGRIIDVSKAAARKLGFKSKGLARVRVEAIGAYGGRYAAR